MTERESIANWVAIFTTYVALDIAYIGRSIIYDIHWIAASFVIVSWVVAVGIYIDESGNRKEEREARVRTGSNHFEISVCKELSGEYLEKLFLLKAIDEWMEYEYLVAVFSLEDTRKLLNDKDVQMVIYSIEIFTIDDDDYLRQIKSESLLGDLKFRYTGVFQDKKTNNYLNENEMINKTKNRAVNVLNMVNMKMYM